ncbi:Ferric iron ABC transporter [Klebsiella michiganensis]|uniref:Ferric iron ABC transporter n=1 Tax=Klebsiella michiganensis TaxID=1134687 RepID=A0A7H4PLF8_9ENTR|nr:Ferric iron ABC transporter [Klebsiella michiganensis]
MAGFAARYRRRDDGAGDLCPAAYLSWCRAFSRRLFLPARNRSASKPSLSSLATRIFIWRSSPGLFWRLVWWRLPSPLGGILAFLMVRTDLPGRRFIEPLILVPIFVSPMVLGFGYVVAAGPVGFFSQWAEQLIGFVPLEYLLDVQHRGNCRADARSACLSLYLFRAAQRRIGCRGGRADGGAHRRCRVMTSVSLADGATRRYSTPAYSLFFLGLEVFGLMAGAGAIRKATWCWATYLYKLTNKLRYAFLSPDGGGGGGPESASPFRW